MWIAVYVLWHEYLMSYGLFVGGMVPVMLLLGGALDFCEAMLQRVSLGKE